MQFSWNSIIKPYCGNDGKIDKAMANGRRGIGIRVLANGAWGFRSTTDLTKDAVREAVDVAVKAARAQDEQKVIASELIGAIN